jgi:pimeloyl-ACP methyl ester carboxylesterase
MLTATGATATADRGVRHARVEVDEIGVFYREAGPAEAPVVLLPHGYPSSSFQFRRLMPALADRWRLVAPDFPGFGYSDTPAGFAYTFDGYAKLLDRFATRLGLRRYALYLHDYGSQIGLRLAIRAPERVAALIIQNGDIYEDALGPKYDGLKAHWVRPTPEGRGKLEDAVSEEGFRDEFLNDVRPELAERIPPDLWRLAWSLTTPERRKAYVGLMEGLQENLRWFPRYQAYLREHRPPTLIAWGPQDGYMPEGSARAYLRDLPDAELHLLDGGHWALETNLEEIVALARDFLGRVHASPETSERPAIARIWRGRTTRDRADEYEAYNYDAGIRPLIGKALGVQTFREDRQGESEFVTISYWPSVEAMRAFAGEDPTAIHHLERDEEFLVELPKRVQVLRLLKSHGATGTDDPAD